VGLLLDPPIQYSKRQSRRPSRLRLAALRSWPLRSWPCSSEAGRSARALLAGPPSRGRRPALSATAAYRHRKAIVKRRTLDGKLPFPDLTRMQLDCDEPLGSAKKCWWAGQELHLHQAVICGALYLSYLPTELLPCRQASHKGTPSSRLDLAQAAQRCRWPAETRGWDAGKYNK